MAGTTRLELATSAVTGQRSNQLNYVPNYEISDLPENLAGQGFCKFCIQRIRRYCPQWQLSLPKPLINFRAHARCILTQRIGGVFTPCAGETLQVVFASSTTFQFSSIE